MALFKLAATMFNAFALGNPPRNRHSQQPRPIGGVPSMNVAQTVKWPARTIVTLRGRTRCLPVPRRRTGGGAVSRSAGIDGWFMIPSAQIRRATLSANTTAVDAGAV